MINVLLLVFAFLSSTIALGQAVEKTGTKVAVAAEVSQPAALIPAPAEEKIELPEMIVEKEPSPTDIWTRVMSVLASLYVGLWALGEILTRVSVWTENKWDNKAAMIVSQITWFIGSFAGKMGWSLPKLVIEDKAETMAAKKSEATKDSATKV